MNLQEFIDQIDKDLTGDSDLRKITEARQRANALTGLGDRLIDHFVTRARAAGVPWSRIGAALGVSKQAAQQRWTGSPFARFTDRAKQAVVLAQQRAAGSGHATVEPEHVLVGLLSVARGRAARAVTALVGDREGDLAGDRRAVLLDVLTGALPTGPGPAPAHIPFAAECEEAMVHATEQAMRWSDPHICTEHLLLGLLAVPDGRATRLLAGLGLDSERVRAEVDRLRAADASQD